MMDLSSPLAIRRTTAPALRLLPPYFCMNLRTAFGERMPRGRSLPVRSLTDFSVPRMLTSPMLKPSGREIVRASAGALLGRAGVVRADPPSLAPRRRDVFGEAGGSSINSSRVTWSSAGELICRRTHGRGAKILSEPPTTKRN
jgi:hypothetical protein